MRTVINLFRAFCSLVMFLVLVGPSVGQSVYTREDAEYVDRTPSYSVLDYIVCLAQSVDTKADALFLPTGLSPKAKECQWLADLIPDSPKNPKPEAVLQRIKDCGFWQRDAKPEVDCTEGNLMSAQAGSWGGKVRSGPGMNYAHLSSLAESDRVDLISDTGVMMNGYPWFRIRYHGSAVGYQWGGILCAIDTPIVGLFQTCKVLAATTKNSGNDENGLDAQTQFAFIDDQLNQTYQNQINSLDSEGVALLKEAQRAWISYRDKECARRTYLTQTAEIVCLTGLTQQRTTELSGKSN